MLSNFTGMEYLRPERSHRDLGIGLIGCGGIARNAQLPSYRWAGFNVQAVNDVIPEAAAEIANRFDIPKHYSSYHQLIEDEAVDVIDIAFPTQGRKEVVQAAAEAGKHLLIQKPLGATLNEAIELVEIAEKHGVLLAVNQNARWEPTYRAAWAALHAGILGDPYLLTHRLVSNQDFTTTKSWFLQESRFQVIQYGVHHIDLMRFWKNKTPTHVMSVFGRRPDQRFLGEMLATIVLTFDDGAQAVLLENNVAHEVRPNNVDFEVFCPHGVLTSREFNQLTVRVEGMSDMSGEIDVQGRWNPHGFSSTMGDLLDAIVDGRHPEVTGRDNLWTLAVVEACYLSARENRQVSIDETLTHLGVHL